MYEHIVLLTRGRIASIGGPGIFVLFQHLLCDALGRNFPTYKLVLQQKMMHLMLSVITTSVADPLFNRVLHYQ